MEQNCLSHQEKISLYGIFFAKFKNIRNKTLKNFAYFKHYEHIFMFNRDFLCNNCTLVINREYFITLKAQKKKHSEFVYMGIPLYDIF